MDRMIRMILLIAKAVIEVLVVEFDERIEDEKDKLKENRPNSDKRNRSSDNFPEEEGQWQEGQ